MRLLSSIRYLVAVAFIALTLGLTGCATSVGTGVHYYHGYPAHGVSSYHYPGYSIGSGYHYYDQRYYYRVDRHIERREHKAKKAHHKRLKAHDRKRDDRKKRHKKSGDRS